MLLALKLFIKDADILEVLVTNSYQVETSTKVKKYYIIICTILKILKYSTP